MLLRHEGLGLEVEFNDDVRTRQVERFWARHRELAGENRIDLTVFEWQVHLLRAALETGIISSADGELDVDDLRPAATRWLAAAFDRELSALHEIPPE